MLLFWAGCALDSPKSDSSVSIRGCAVGDIMLGRGVSRHSRRDGGLDYPFRKIGSFFRSYDLAFGNLESPLTAGGIRQQKGFTFRAPPQLAVRLKEVGFSVLSLANNHAWDFGPQGLADTIEALDRAGIGHSGISSPDGSCRLLITDAAGLKIGWLAYCDPKTDNFISRRGPGSPDFALLDQERLESDIKSALRRTDLLIVSLHWGREYSRKVRDSDRRLARQAIEQGACLVLGHHPHILQGIEVWQGGLIAYSLGNFIFDQTTQERNETVLLDFTLHECGVVEARIYPVQIQNSQPRLADRDSGRAILERLADLSADLGTGIEIDLTTEGRAIGRVILPHRPMLAAGRRLDRGKNAH